jgi:hypothetical protein
VLRKGAPQECCAQTHAKQGEILIPELHSAAQRSRPADKRSRPADNLLYFLFEFQPMNPNEK